MTRLLRATLRRLTALAATLIIGFAALTLGLRLALPHADGLREVVASALGDHLGADLQVGTLGIRLRGLQPELTLDDAQLHDPLSGERLLALDALRVDLDLRASLFAWSPRIDGVTLVGAHIEVRRGPDGRIRVRGLGELGGGDGDAAAFFLREGHFSLADSELLWTDTHAGVPTLAFQVRRLDLINIDKRHRLRLDAAPPGDPAGELTLLADLTGLPRHPERWSGRIHAEWRGSDLARVLRGRLPAGFRLTTDAVHLSSWNQLSDGRLVRSVNRLWLDDLVLQRTAIADAPAGAVPATGPDDGAEQQPATGRDQAPDATPAPAQAPSRLELGDVGALARWEPRASGWRLDIPELRLFGSLRGAEETALRLTGGTASDTAGRPGRQWVQGWLAGIPLARLAEAVSFAAPVALPDALRTLLDGRVTGRLSDLRVRLDPPADEADPGWLVQGRIDDLGLGPAPAGPDAPLPAGPIPPVDGLDLRFAAAPDRGTLDIDATDVQLDLRPHLIAPLRLTRAAGRLHWRVAPGGGLALDSRALAADTPDLTTLSRLSLHLPPDASPKVDLHTHIRGGDADAVPRYLPASKMDDRLEDWLARAIVAGRLDSGDLLLRGPLADFPFDAGNGWFRLELRLRDGVLDYQPPRRRAPGAVGMSSAEDGTDAAGAGRWPRLEDIDATLRFDRRRLDIEVAAARILNTTVTGGSGRIPNLWRPETMSIRATGAGPLPDGLAFLGDTPLAAKVGGIPRALAATGDGELDLMLEVPLRRGLRFGFAGDLRFAEDATVTLRDAGLRLTDIAGDLHFDPAGLNAEGIRARLGEQPLGLAIATRRPEADAPARTEIAVSGSTPVDAIAAALPSPWWTLAEGRADWQLQLTLNNADAVAAAPPVDLRLSSDLAGVALDLPAPFGKTAGETRALRLNTRLAPDSPLEISARLGDLGSRLVLRRRDDGLAPERIAVDLNGLSSDLPDASGIAVRGRFGELDLGPWLAWQRGHAELLRGAGAEATGTALPLLPVRLAADALVLGPLRFTDLEAALTPTPGGGWRIGAEAAGNSGTVTLPGSDGGALRISLDNLDIEPLLAGDGGGGDPAGPDPRAMPALSLQIEALRRGDHALGRLRLDLDRTPQGLRLSELSLTGPLVSAAGTGTWTRDDTGYTRTAIDVDLASDDLGELVRNAGFYSALAGAPSQAGLSLAWPGGPGTFSLARARGRLSVDIGAGRMLDVEPGVGRMLGILNLGALERRLALDFSDVVDAGFGFDAITGKINIGNGKARIGGLDIRSSTADIRLRGVTDLVDRTFDQTARVTPKIGTGVAIAGAVAGGPLVGAAVFLADKVSGDAVDRLVSYEYQITGPWSDPVVRRVAGSGAAQSLPDLLLPEQATSRGNGTTPRATAPGNGRNGADSPARPVSPFLDTD